MALIQITTSLGAISAANKQNLATELGKLTYAAEGFGQSALAPLLTWCIVEEKPAQAMMLAIGNSPAPLYYVRITVLEQALDVHAKQALGMQVTRALLTLEGKPLTQENAVRVWVRFIDVKDGDLVVGGESTSLAGLKAMMAQAA